MAGFADMDRDGNSDALVFSPTRQSPPVAMLIDLDQNSGNVTLEQLANPDARGRWDAEVAIHMVRGLRAFYDTDNDGAYDLIVDDPDGDRKLDAAVRLANGKWSPDPTVTGGVLDAAYLKDAQLRRRFAAFK